MSTTTRILLGYFLGFAVGLCVGPVSLWGFYARHVWRNREEWPEWTTGLALAYLVSSCPAAINGAIGGGEAALTGQMPRRTVTIFPVFIHVVVGLIGLLTEPKSSVGLQLYALLFSSVMWAAGRIGQRIGRALYCIKWGHDEGS